MSGSTPRSPAKNLHSGHPLSRAQSAGTRAPERLTGTTQTTELHNPHTSRIVVCAAPLIDRLRLAPTRSFSERYPRSFAKKRAQSTCRRGKEKVTCRRSCACQWHGTRTTRRLHAYSVRGTSVRARTGPHLTAHRLRSRYHDGAGCQWWVCRDVGDVAPHVLCDRSISYPSRMHGHGRSRVRGVTECEK